VPAIREDGGLLMFKIGRVPFSEHPHRVFQVFDGRSRCVGAWKTQAAALRFGLATHPKGYLLHVDDYSGIGMAMGNHYAVVRGATPGPQRRVRIRGFEGRVTEAMRRQVRSAIRQARAIAKAEGR
jgi:hypothetical protein